MENKSKLKSDLEALKLRNYKNPENEKQGKPEPEKKNKSAEIKPEAKNKNKYTEQEISVPQERLQEAVIWSEILGKPVSKRKRRRA
jgi:hypothetical protein